MATIRLWNVNNILKYIPDYELCVSDLTIEDMKEIRDLVQTVARSKNRNAETTKQE